MSFHCPNCFVSDSKAEVQESLVTSLTCFEPTKKQACLLFLCKINRHESNSMWLALSDPLTRPIYPLQPNAPIVLNLSPHWQANILIPGSWVVVSWSLRGRCEMRHLCSSKTAQSSLKPWHSALKVTECLRWFYSSQLAAYSAGLTEGGPGGEEPPYKQWGGLMWNGNSFTLMRINLQARRQFYIHTCSDHFLQAQSVSF